MADTSTVPPVGEQPKHQSGDGKDPVLTVEELQAQNKALQDSLKAASDEAKKYRQLTSKIAEEKELAEKAKLEAEGNFKEIAEREKQRAKQLEDETLKTKAAYKWTSIKSAAEAEAAKLGCVDTDALIRLLEIDLKDINVSDDFAIDRESLSKKIQDAQKSRPYLFSKAAPNVKDAPPASGKPQPAKGTKDMNTAELEAHYRKLNGF